MLRWARAAGREAAARWTGATLTRHVDVGVQAATSRNKAAVCIPYLMAVMKKDPRSWLEVASDHSRFHDRYMDMYWVPHPTHSHTQVIRLCLLLSRLCENPRKKFMRPFSVIAQLALVAASTHDAAHAHESRAHVHAHASNVSAHHSSAAAAASPPPLLAPTPPAVLQRPSALISANTTSDARAPTYAYEDTSDSAGDDSDDAAPKETPQEKAAVEQHLWAELDIDEDRDEPVFKVIVILVTLGVLAYFMRTYWCTRCVRHHDSLSRGRYATADLGHGADECPPRGSRGSRDSHEEETSFAHPPSRVLPGSGYNLHLKRADRVPKPLGQPRNAVGRAREWSLDVFTGIADRLTL